jgi:hypothetical protein
VRAGAIRKKGFSFPKVYINIKIVLLYTLQIRELQFLSFIVHCQSSSSFGQIDWGGCTGRWEVPSEVRSAVAGMSKDIVAWAVVP